MHRRGHVKHALRQLDTLAGALVDDLIKQLQRKVIRIAWLLHLQLAQIQIAAGGVRLLIEPRMMPCTVLSDARICDSYWNTIKNRCCKALLATPIPMP